MHKVNNNFQKDQIEFGFRNVATLAGDLENVCVQYMFAIDKQKLLQKIGQKTIYCLKSRLNIFKSLMRIIYILVSLVLISSAFALLAPMLLLCGFFCLVVYLSLSFFLSFSSCIFVGYVLPIEVKVMRAISLKMKFMLTLRYDRDKAMVGRAQFSKLFQLKMVSSSSLAAWAFVCY